jgi:hypothetical protein
MKRLFGVVLGINILLLLLNMFSHDDRETVSSGGLEQQATTLMLLSERASPAGPGNEAPNEPSSSSSAVPGGVETCFALGPFSRGEDAMGAVMQLKARDLQAQMRKVSLSGATRFWVLLPPLSSRDEAKAVLRKMHEQDIDSFVITKGTRTNGISVGLYTDVTEAQSRRDELRRKGFSVVIDERASARSEYWIDVQGPGNATISEIESGLSVDFSSLRLERQGCP